MQPSQELVYRVRAALIKKGTSLRAVCVENNIDTGNIYKVLRGEFKGETSREALETVLTAAFSDSQIKRMSLEKYVSRFTPTSTSSLVDASASPVCCA